MALRLVGSRDQAAFTLTTNEGNAWASWEGQSLPWCENLGYRLALLPGRYRVESPAGFELLTSGWASQGTDVLVEATDGAKIYGDNSKTGVFYITRLA